MVSPILTQHVGRRWLGVLHVLILLGLALFLSSCDPGGSPGSLTPPASPSAQAEQQAIQSLLDLYRQALVEEDIDRLQTLLQPAPVLRQAASRRTARQAADGTFADLATFRQALSATFVTQAVMALEIPADKVVIAPDRRRVTFLEVESTLDPADLVQATRVFHTTWQLARGEAEGVMTFRIAAVTRRGPLVEVHTPGLLLAGPPAPVEVRAASPAFALAAADLTEPATGGHQHLPAVAGRVQGTFIAAATPGVAGLVVRAVGTDGTALVFTHRYRLHQAREGIAQRLVGTGTTRFLAVTAAADGTVWAGGEEGRLYRVAPDTLTAELVGTLQQVERIEDMRVDAHGRLQVVVVGAQRAGVIVREQDEFCQTVNVLDPAYPLRDGEGRPSPSTRAVAGADGGMVLAGSDGGVVAVRETFAPGQCAVVGGTVAYDAAVRRQSSALPTNTVPALVVGQDGALWLGTALGLTRLHQGQFTHVPFHAEVSVQGDAATLEAFFRDLAAAIFEARPIETVAQGDVSFVQAFGGPLRKADLIFSLVEAAPGMLWVGTLGGGLRRVEVRDGVPLDTLHLTRQDGLGSNVIFALAMGPDRTLWVATDEGLSRVKSRGESVDISNFAGLEGVPGPVRDVAVDRDGAVWLATDEGLFRLHPASLDGGGGGGGGESAGQLIPVAGNNQRALPGQELPTPLVVRLEDQFGRPVAGETLTATLRQGEADFLSDATVTTDAQGEARFRLRVQQSPTDLVVEVAAPARPQVAPVRFLAIIGTVDTPGRPEGVAVAGDLVFIAAGHGGLQVIDVSDPTRPEHLHQDAPVLFPGPGGQPRKLALQGNRAYVATSGPLRLHIVDITHPRAASFPADTNFDGVSDVILRSIDLKAPLDQGVRAVAVQGNFVYVLTLSPGIDPGTLQVVHIGDPATAEVVHSRKLPVPRPRGLAIAGDMMYVPAGTEGLLVFDLHDPARPVPAATLGIRIPPTP